MTLRRRVEKIELQMKMIPTARTADLSSLSREELLVLKKVTEDALEKEERHPTGRLPLLADISVLTSSDDLRIFSQITQKFSAARAEARK